MTNVKKLKLPEDRTPSKRFKFNFNILNKPPYETMEGWYEWRRKVKNKHPVLYFLLERVPTRIRVLKTRIKDIKWWFFHRFHPKHQYNIIKPATLGPGYYDPDTRILHAVMHELTDFLSYCDKHTDWDATPEHKHARAEMQAVADWWKEYNELDERLDREYPIPPLQVDDLFYAFSQKNQDKPDVIAYRAAMDKHHEIEEQYRKQENEMLIRVIKVREFMWD